MRLTILTGLTILLAGCATTTSNYYSSTIQSWQGGSLSRLKSIWGQPDREIITAGGNKILTYKTTGYRTYSTTGSPAIGVNVAGSNPIIVTQPSTNSALETRTLSLNCYATFVVNQKGVITSAQSTGNGCYASHAFADRLGNR
jgi:hypothetical protein